MSLQVWLPLNGNLNNHGLSNVTITNYGATVDNNGKIGKCYYFNGSSYIKISLPSNLTTLKNTSICMWVKGNNAFGGISSDGNTKTPCMTCFNPWQFTDGSNWKYISGGAYNDGNWHHVVCTMDDTTIRTYIDGSLVATNSISSLGIITDLTSSNFIELGCDHPGGDEYLTGYINDFRVYDECISPKMVNEISKGLVCHYKLSGVGGENLIPKSRINNRGCTSFVYDEATNVYDCIAPAGSTGWGYGIVFSRGTPEIPVGIGETICFSLEVKPDIDCRWQCDVNNAVADGSVIGGNDYDDISLRTTSNQNIVAGVWNKVYWTYTAKDYDLYDADSNWGIVTSGVTNEIHFQIRNIKVEYGSSPTPWCPNPSDTLYSTLGYNDRIEYDCSGYGNNGTKVGNIVWSGDSPRYNGSYIPTNNSSYISTTLNTPGYANSYTISYWAKISNMDNKMVFGFGDGNRLNVYPTNSVFCWNTGDSADNPFQNNGTKVAFASYNGAWHHYCITGDGTTTTLYIDGEKKGTARSYKAITGTKLFLSGWDTGASYKWTGGNISDFRLYSTCLSESDVKSLYNVSASIDKTGVLSAYEFVEEG